MNTLVSFTPPDEPRPGCALCELAGGRLVWQDRDWRVIRADDADHPAYYRVIHRAHVAEFSDLAGPARDRCMALVLAVERALTEALRPTKINLAALGNVVPHLHWHVIARFDWDSHFPQAVWGPRQREVTPPAVERLACPLQLLDQRVGTALDGA